MLRQSHLYSFILLYRPRSSQYYLFNFFRGYCHRRSTGILQGKTKLVSAGFSPKKHSIDNGSNLLMMNNHEPSLPGWRFGTMEFYDFPFSWECHHPNWRTHIFQRGRSTTNQPKIYLAPAYHCDLAPPVFNLRQDHSRQLGQELGSAEALFWAQVIPVGVLKKNRKRVTLNKHGDVIFWI